MTLVGRGYLQSFFFPFFCLDTKEPKGQDALRRILLVTSTNKTAVGFHASCYFLRLRRQDAISHEPPLSLYRVGGRFSTGLWLFFSLPWINELIRDLRSRQGFKYLLKTAGGPGQLGGGGRRLCAFAIPAFALPSLLALSCSTLRDRSVMAKIFGDFSSTGKVTRRRQQYNCPMKLRNTRSTWKTISAATNKKIVVAQDSEGRPMLKEWKRT